MDHLILKNEQKALEINLDQQIYGTFAEIGAGQEVARIFFQVGAAAGTIAKTMSAYDKIYSDRIYGKEPSGRYVCESRVYKMLDHEYDLMVERLQTELPNSTFFVFADTVSAINYSKTIKGDGWLGVRFQLTPNGKPNDLVLHVKMKDTNNKLQQEAVGKLGVNMIYSCYFYKNDIKAFVASLLDGLHERVEVDMIRLTGPDFDHVDNRLLGLYLLEYGLTEVTMIGPDGQSVHASEFLYKRSLMVVRGHFRPPTKVTIDVIKSSFDQFKNEQDVDPDKSFVVCELTLENLVKDGKIDHEDFLARADLLGALGQTFIISNCHNHQRLINYLADYKIKKLGLVIGVHELLDIINNKYESNRDGRLLVAFGELFTRNILIYAYPALKEEGSTEIMEANNLPVPEGIRFLYRHLVDSQQIVPVDNYNRENLHIFPYLVFNSILADDGKWEDMVPAKLVPIIKNRKLFQNHVEV
ncbi:TonB-dependent receptor [Portibacter lacus]|uniref:TonB-dependent receptor n=1 Tax=Portibacter lacus TaxID=1099794 RepID=A0AA37WGC9_9BACT|nr:TonB-dependent receptor [Portibacter lacus]GLR17880.1 hypothetical protein GCM10007940_24950 [Portibacter lacus]